MRLRAAGETKSTALAAGADSYLIVLDKDADDGVDEHGARDEHRGDVEDGSERDLDVFVRASHGPSDIARREHVRRPVVLRR